MQLTRFFLAAATCALVAGTAQAQRRGGVRAMTLTSTAFESGAAIPARYSQAGDELSPPLAWSGAPDSVKSFVLVMHDVEAFTGNGLDDMLHWMVWNIPATATSLPEGVRAGMLPDSSRQISATGPFYRGPGAAASGPAHHYVFELYALDVLLDVPMVGQSPPATRAAVLAAMAGHVRGKGVLVGTFRRAGV